MLRRLFVSFVAVASKYFKATVFFVYKIGRKVRLGKKILFPTDGARVVPYR